jgi:hypothetical protein
VLATFTPGVFTTATAATVVVACALFGCGPTRPVTAANNPKPRVISISLANGFIFILLDEIELEGRGKQATLETVS